MFDRVPSTVYELSEVSDKLIECHNRSFNRPRMSPSFREFPFAHHGIQVALASDRPADLSGCRTRLKKLESPEEKGGKPGSHDCGFVGKCHL